jgi:hypothetical protein
MNKNQHGFAPLHIVLALVIVTLIVGAGLYVSRHNSTSSHSKSNTSENTQDTNGGSYVSLDAYIANMSTPARISSIEKSLGKLSDCGTASSDGVDTIINSCFEDAFATCKAVSATTNSLQAGVVTRYVIAGKDSKTGHCIGGFYYTAPEDPTYKGLGTFCALDTSEKPFLQAMSSVNSGSDKEIETRCKQPANPRHI